MTFTNQKVWDKSFEEQIRALTFNTAPVDVIVRNVSYYLRARYKDFELAQLKFLEIGCGGGVNLAWLAHKGVSVSGIDISQEALALCEKRLRHGGVSWNDLLHASAEELPFEENIFSGVVESCVIQHIPTEKITQTFNEIYRVLKVGGVFIGHMLDRDSSAFSRTPSSSGDVLFQDDSKPRFYLTNIGHAHFFSEEELRLYLKDFSEIDISKTTCFLPKEEAQRRGYSEYKQSFWSVYAIK